MSGGCIEAETLAELTRRGPSKTRQSAPGPPGHREASDDGDQRRDVDRWAQASGSIPNHTSGATTTTGQSGEWYGKKPPNTVVGPAPANTFRPIPRYLA